MNYSFFLNRNVFAFLLNIGFKITTSLHEKNYAINKKYVLI